MANPILVSITLPNGNTYDLVDQGARDLIKELMNFREWLGVTTSSIEDGSTTNPIVIDGETVTATAGDVVSRDSDHADFIFSSTGVWQNFGNLQGLGALAFKDSASGSYTPAGSISATFTGDATTSTGTFTPEGSVSSSGGTKTIKQFKTAGEMPTYTVADGNLTITAGSVPTGEDVSVGDGSVTSTFSGTEGNLSVSGTPSGSISSTFTGTEGNLSVAGTPTGSISASFTGTAGSVSVSGTPTGSVSGSFTGNAATITVS